MSRINWMFVTVLVSCNVFCACGGGTSDQQNQLPCGQRNCAAEEDNGVMPDYVNEISSGKSDEAGVQSLVVSLTADGVLDAEDVAKLFEACGDSVSIREMELIREAIENPGGYQVPSESLEKASFLAFRANLFDTELEQLQEPDFISYGGSQVPEAVKQLVAKARFNGAVAYDVNETNSSGEGLWDPYPSTTPPVKNMTFKYTEITPEKLVADLNNTTVEYQAIIGTKSMSGGGEQVTYETRKGGTGNITAQYDEAYHPNIFARGTDGQIWANNCAILSDGSLHCLPASRRSVYQDLILTNPHLSRCNDRSGYQNACKHLLYHGHIDVQAGVVVGVEISGRLSKRAAKGQAIFVDPIAVLQAWGFEIDPNVSLQFGNTSSGVPVRDQDRGILTAPKKP